MTSLNKILMLTVLPLGLAACSASTKSVKPLNPVAVPPTLVEYCESPVELPSGEMSQSDAEIAWRKDRINLKDCGDRHRILVDHVVGGENDGKR